MQTGTIQLTTGTSCVLFDHKVWMNTCSAAVSTDTFSSELINMCDKMCSKNSTVYLKMFLTVLPSCVEPSCEAHIVQ